MLNSEAKSNNVMAMVRAMLYVSDGSSKRDRAQLSPHRHLENSGWCGLHQVDLECLVKRLGQMTTWMAIHTKNTAETPALDPLRSG